MFAEESCPPTADLTQPKEVKKKWDGKKQRSLATVLAQCKEGSFLKMTDTSGLSDVWFLPLKVRRTGSGTVLTVTCAIVISGTSLIMHNHDYKIFAEDLLKMMFMVYRFRCAITGKSMAGDYEMWKSGEQEKFATGSDVVRGDSTDAAFAEYLFCQQNFRAIGFSKKSTDFAYVFRKINQHVYVSDIVGGTAMPTVYGSVDNDNVLQCTASRGNYTYCIECRLMWIGGVEDEEDEEMPASQLI